MTTDSYDFHKDQVLANKYRVISLLGKGGMGVVYRVEQIFLGKQLALKTIEQSEVSDFTLSRFQAEARATFAVNHPNIIAIHDYGVLEGGIPFMAMELLEGETLGDFLQRRALKIDEALDIFIQVCFGLAHAHDCGVVHRDIKPNNIMLMNKLSWDTEGSVKVLDFGIAKLTQHDGGEIQALTRTGEIFGSPFYMSPEQCSGGKIDKRSDVYSLGCVMFEALTGTPPFVGDSALNTMMLHQGNQAPSMKEAALGAEFPPQIESIIQKMLSKKPEERYQNLGQAAHDLGAFKRKDFENLSTARFDASTKDKPAKTQVTMRKTSYAYLLGAVALVSSLTTAAAMYPNIPQNKHLAVPVKEVYDTGTVKTLINLPQLEFDRDINDGACRISKTQFADDKMLERFNVYTGVQELNVSQSTGVTDAGMAHLKLSKPLILNVSKDKNLKSVNNISNLTSLKNLDLSETGITDSALPLLARMPQLKMLRLTGCKLTPENLPELAKSNSLEVVELTKDPPVPAKIMAQLKHSMPQCTFTGYGFAPMFDIPEVRPVLITLEKRYALIKKANPSAAACAGHKWAIAEQKFGSGSPNPQALDQKEKLLAERKECAAMLEKTGNDAARATMMAAIANLAAELHHDNEAFTFAKRGVRICLDTMMHDDADVVKECMNNFWAAQKSNHTFEGISFLEEALALVNKYNSINRTFVGTLNELIGSNYYTTGHPDKGLPFLKDCLKYYEDNQATFPAEYARAFIELAHCTPNAAERKKLYDTGFEKIEALNYPDQVNLREHYCDGCLQMARIYNKEHDRAKGLAYLKRAQNAANRITNDNETRKHFFENLINFQKEGKEI